MYTIDTASQLANDVSRQTERMLLDQLNDFISRGLIEIERGPMSLIESEVSRTVEFRQTIKLVLKDKEYINKLERDNAALKHELQMLLGIKERLAIHHT